MQWLLKQVSQVFISPKGRIIGIENLFSPFFTSLLKKPTIFKIVFLSCVQSQIGRAIEYQQILKHLLRKLCSNIFKFFNIIANALPFSVQILHKVPCLEIKLLIYCLFKYQLILISLYIYTKYSTSSCGRVQTLPIAFCCHKWGKERQSHLEKILIIQMQRQVLDTLCFTDKDWIHSQIWNFSLSSKEHLRPDSCVKNYRRD